MSPYVTWLRSRVGSRRVLLAYATAVVADTSGRILCQKRRDFGRWGLPGGVIEVGEDVEECARREVAEETGVVADIGDLVGVYSSPDYAFTYPNGDRVQQFSVCYAGAAAGGVPACRDGESLAARFFPADRLPPLLPWYRDMVEDYRCGRRHVYTRGSAGSPAAGEPGYLSLRPLVGRETLVVPAAAALLRDPRGSVLMVRRADNGQWSMPGGAMELGERVDVTLVRETEEETGVRVEPERLEGVLAGRDFQFTFVNGDRIQAVTAFFTCRIVAGALAPDGAEVTELRYFDRKALPEGPAWIGVLRRFLDDNPRT